MLVAVVASSPAVSVGCPLPWASSPTSRPPPSWGDDVRGRHQLMGTSSRLPHPRDPIGILVIADQRRTSRWVRGLQPSGAASPTVRLRLERDPVSCSAGSPSERLRPACVEGARGVVGWGRSRLADGVRGRGVGKRPSHRRVLACVRGVLSPYPRGRAIGVVEPSGASGGGFVNGVGRRGVVLPRPAGPPTEPLAPGRDESEGAACGGRSAAPPRPWRVDTFQPPGGMIRRRPASAPFRPGGSSEGGDPALLAGKRRLELVGGPDPRARVR